MYAYFNRTVPELTKEAGSHYFITGGILEMPVAADRAQRAEAITREMEAEIARMLAAKVDISASATLRRIFTGPAVSRTPERVYYYLTEELKTAGPKEIAPHIATLRRLGRELLETRPPRALVLEEDARPLVTRVLLRGNVRTPGDEVQPGPRAASAAERRARIASASRAGWPAATIQTARVMVSLGRAVRQRSVHTPEDFGLQGEPPSHPSCSTGSRSNSWSATGRGTSSNSS